MGDEPMLLEEYRASRSPLSGYGLPVVEDWQRRPPRVCGNCDKTENQVKFKVCLRCKQLRIPKYLMIHRHYCCVECQTEHWKVHRLEHSDYETDFGAYLDNDRLLHYEGEVKRLGIKFASICNYDRRKVLNMLIENVGKFNILSLSCYNKIRRIWIAYLKAGPRVENFIKRGFKHATCGLKLTTYPRAFRENEPLIFDSSDVREAMAQGYTFVPSSEESSGEESDPEAEVSLRFEWIDGMPEEALMWKIVEELQCKPDCFMEDDNVWIVTVPETRKIKKILQDGFYFDYNRIPCYIQPTRMVMGEEARKKLEFFKIWNQAS